MMQMLALHQVYIIQNCSMYYSSARLHPAWRLRKVLISIVGELHSALASTA